MATISGLMLPLQRLQPYDYAGPTINAINAASGITQGQTALLNLQEARRQQDEQAAARQFYQANPDYLLGGGQTIGTMGAGGGPGAITQGPLAGMPGQAQTIAAPPDLSQYASGTPPATIGTMGHPPRQDPLRALMQQNPDAALQVMDMRTKVQTQVLGMQEKKLAAFGQILQGATDQASWDQAREQIGRVDPQAAARMPPQFNKEVRDQMLEQSLSVKDSLTARIDQAKIQALLRGQDVDMLKLQQQGGKLNYQTDAQGNIVAVPEFAGGTGGVQSRPVLGADGQPIRSIEGQKLTQQQQTQVRTQEGELRTHVDTLLKDYYSVRDAMGRIEASGADPSAAGDLALITAFMKMLDPTTGVRDVEFKNAATAGGLLEQVKARLGYVQSGERLSDEMRKDLLERSRRLYAQYEKDYGQVKQQYRDLTTRLGGNPANVVLETGSTAAQPPTAVVTKSQLSEWATQRSKDLGRPVTVEEVTKDVKAKGFRVE